MKIDNLKLLSVKLFIFYVSESLLGFGIDIISYFNIFFNGIVGGIVGYVNYF